MSLIQSTTQDANFGYGVSSQCQQQVSVTNSSISLGKKHCFHLAATKVKSCINKEDFQVKVNLTM